MTKIKRVLLGLLVLDVALFVLSGIPAFRDADHGIKNVIGGIGWGGFLLTTLVLLVVCATLLVRSGLERRSA